MRTNGQLTAEDVKTVVEVVRAGSERIGSQNLTMLDGGKYLRPRTDGQGRYVQALRDNDVTICVGPAGTGKTFLAVGMAVTLLRQGAVKKIVLVRPAVEAGERLGFLPGDLVAKINPYLRPLFDALNDMMEYEQVKKYMENDIIEIVPLAYMRGRTLNNAVIILDEGQNATIAQMKMFLTRMGMNSKIIVTGDITQIDLPPTAQERPDRRGAPAARHPAAGHRSPRRDGHRPPRPGAADRQGLRGGRAQEEIRVTSQKCLRRLDCAFADPVPAMLVAE